MASLWGQHSDQTTASLQPADQGEILAPGTKAGGLSPAGLAATEHRLAFLWIVDELRHEILDVCYQRGEHDEPILVDLAMMQRVNERRSEDAVLNSTKFERILALGGGCQHRPSSRFVQPTNACIGHPLIDPRAAIAVSEGAGLAGI